ncbi:uncharacterized protein B0I36DRAFT_343457 [Microdochium trichocladiopsis]|uniref:FAD-binding PCMH-type domain-containing protein n=1 Tax=Microdochium trichocladiopsis TaxID=1682393 RepID=A0A9P8YFK3_9PEZI|nr:uncharacterized protein B0I36DRAFT_343457 [Microdochium trichocladiopsis]KAH7039591.1 hypothetical protein B0I36DRAFT_343457 [Microdochium trichocladiopsis]
MKASSVVPLLALASQADASKCQMLQAKCCGKLAGDPVLQGKVLFPGDSQGRNDARLASYYSANAALSPWCMVLPTETLDVSRIASILQENACPFGMRSGAHSAFSGSNGVSDGVTVDFGYLNATTYTPGSDIASIQPGSDWGSAYETLDPFGVTVVGGRASVVGVGGFISGGGYSFHSAKYGWGADTVRNFEIVLANGTVVNANKDENADLWKAQKGGSGNFGFITRLDMEVVDTNQLWAGIIVYDTPEVEASWQAYLDFVDNMGNQEAESQALVAMVANEKTISHTALISNSRGDPEPETLSAFLALPNLSSTIQRDTVAKVVPAFTGPTPLGLFSNWLVELYASNMEVLRHIDDTLATYTDKIRAAAPTSVFQILIELQPVTPSMVRHSTSKGGGGNILGLEHVVAAEGGGPGGSPAVMFLIALTVDTAANQDIVLPLVLEFRDAVNQIMTTEGYNRDWVYAPYAWKGQDPLSRYGADNVALMRDVSARYDPQGMFQELRVSGFKIPKDVA